MTGRLIRNLKSKRGASGCATLLRETGSEEHTDLARRDENEANCEEAPNLSDQKSSDSLPRLSSWPTASTMTIDTARNDLFRSLLSSLKTEIAKAKMNSLEVVSRPVLKALRVLPYFPSSNRALHSTPSKDTA